MNKWTLIVSVLVIGCLLASLLTWYSIIPRNQNLITLRGTLEPGVEAGCVLLRTDDGAQYLLMDWSNYPAAGTRVTVVGQADNNVASYCMQGQAAVHVVSISTLEPNTTTVSAPLTFGTGSQTFQEPTTTASATVTIDGYIFSAVENPECYPQCLMPSFIFNYLYVPPGTGCTGSMTCSSAPRYYRLLNITGSGFWTTAPNGTYATVTGILVIPSSWNCISFYVPKLCMSGDVYAQNITYHELDLNLSS